MQPSMRILEGLPVYGPDALRFSSTGQGLHSEGLVVEFECGDDSPWVGNFARGLTTYDCVELHPDEAHVIVIAGGGGYVLDAGAKTVVETFGGAIVGILRDPARNHVVFNHQGIFFTAVGPSGWAWESRRVSWEGMRALVVIGDVLRGEALDLDDAWVSFEVDLKTGESTGGSFPAGVGMP